MFWITFSADASVFFKEDLIPTNTNELKDPFQTSAFLFNVQELSSGLLGYVKPRLRIRGTANPSICWGHTLLWPLWMRLETCLTLNLCIILVIQDVRPFVRVSYEISSSYFWLERYIFKNIWKLMCLYRVTQIQTPLL